MYVPKVSKPKPTLPETENPLKTSCILDKVFYNSDVSGLINT